MNIKNKNKEAMLNQAQQFWTQIKGAKSVALLVGRDYIDDSLASALALKKIINSLDINADIISILPATPLIDHLKTTTEIKHDLKQQREFVISLATTNTQVDKVKYKMEPGHLDFIVLPASGGFFTESDVSVKANGFAYDLIITINIQDLLSLGEIYQNNADFFYAVPIINIDNQASNDNFGQINIINFNATSATEIIYQLCREQESDLINHETATCLLAGIISRTKSYKTETVTPQSLLATADLLKLGASRDEIIERLYRNRSLSTLQLWGKLLSGLESMLNDKILYTKLTQADLANIDDSDINQILDELISLIPSAMVVLIFFDQNDTTTLLTASPKNINCLSLLKEYQPSGAKRLVWLDLPLAIAEAQEEILRLVSAKLEKLN